MWPFNALKTGLIAAAAIVLASGGAYLKGRWDGSSDMKAKIAAKAAAEAVERIIEMEKSDAEFRRLDALGKCLRFAHDSGLPDSACDRWRRVSVHPVQ